MPATKTSNATSSLAGPSVGSARNLGVLIAAQALGACASPMNTLIAGIIGMRLAPSPRLATLPVALLLVGLAVATVPAARISARWGRRRAFIGGALFSSAVALCAALAVHLEAFWSFCATTCALGFNQAFVQQYRFAAAETVPKEKISRAVSLVLLGTLLAAWLGPELARRGPRLGGASAQVGAYVLLALVALLSALTLAGFRDLSSFSSRAPQAATSSPKLWTRPGFLLAVAGAGLGYAVMVFVMTATPLSMHVRDGHSMGHTATVIQSHIAAMFLPSLFSGRLVARLGSVRVMWIGLALNLACLAVAASGQTVVLYWSALVLLGIGWNFLFVASTALLVTQYEPEEKRKAEAVNDLCVFTIAASSSLLSGGIMESLGWGGVLALSGIPVLLLAGILLWYQGRALRLT